MAILQHYSATSPALDRFQSIPREVRAEPIVKWAGGKKRLLPYFDPLFPVHFETYHEPFIGGASVYLFLAHVGRVRRAILSDLNAELIHLYRVVRDDVERLVATLADFRYEKEFYYSVRDQEPATLDPIARAARTLFLNRTCFNGLYRVNSRGRFNVPFGRYDNPVICNGPNLRNMHKMLQGVELQHWSFETVAELAKPGDFIYLDPPYQPVSATANFTAYTDEAFSTEHQGRLSEVFRILDRRGCLLMLSNSNTALIRDLYRGYDQKEVQAARAINRDGRRRGKVTELVVRNYA